MNNAKLKILEETFKNKFDIETFKKFTREFFNEPEMIQENRRTGIWREYEEHVASYYRIARYTDCDENNMIVLAVELKKDKSVERARSMQRNFISRVLDENNLEAAIVAFYSQNEPNWRLSFVRLDYSFTDKGIELDLTPARRYSYLVGENEPNHTAQAQLLRIFEDDTKNPTLDEIEEAFSVEKVTKEFFTLYKDKYLDLKEHLETNEAFIEETEKLGFEVHKFSEQFAKKLMGQLAFLYFLQKKGWLGVRIMPPDHLFPEGEFKDIYISQDQAHQAILQKVFKKSDDGNMKLLPTKLTKLTEHEAGLLSDCFAETKYDMPWGSGNRTFIREIFDYCNKNTNRNFFKDYLEPFFNEALNTKRKNHYYHRFNCKIPFLNGGLFEPVEGYHWRDVDFEIPNELFSNEAEKGRDADGILDIFDRFNFTMNEDEPLEKEVAVDPEMLGKIFENLLEVSDRKSKGAFYTPREIVHYMCQESLINYLVNEVNVPYEDMK
ncbi:MAG TPA: SAM-dependent DNA methyltransferase, partial [Thermoanaerobacterales bacterium]|nr:SAM-dependent DNA methyltransferase [Thermoanaerobacterales bacterium]